MGVRTASGQQMRRCVYIRFSIMYASQARHGNDESNLTRLQSLLLGKKEEETTSSFGCLSFKAILPCIGFCYYCQ